MFQFFMCNGCLKFMNTKRAQKEKIQFMLQCAFIIKLSHYFSSNALKIHIVQSQWATLTTRMSLQLVVAFPQQQGPATQPSQQAPQLQPIRFQLSVHFKGMLASFGALLHSFKSPAAGPVRQTSHIFLEDLQRDSDAQTDKERICFHKTSCPKTSGPNVLHFGFTPKLRGSGCSRLKPFPLYSHMGLTVL